jgi:hypothetical protein
MPESNGHHEPVAGGRDPLEHLRDIIGAPSTTTSPTSPPPPTGPTSAPPTPPTDGSNCEPGLKTFARVSWTWTTTSSPAAGGGTTVTSKPSPP